MAPAPTTQAAGPAFRRLREGNAFEETVERLLQAVRLGQVREGERLPAERDLAVRLGVSRATLRQAIRALAEEGYVESRRGRSGGTFVRPAGDWRPGRVPRAPGPVGADLGAELLDALTLRSVLEPGAVEAAARRRHGAADEALLRGLLDELAAGGVAGYRRLDSRLHVALADLAGSPSLTAAVADTRMRLNDLLDAIPLLPPNLVHSDEQHERVVREVLAGRPAQARAAMTEHLAGTAALLRAFLG